MALYRIRTILSILTACTLLPSGILLQTGTVPVHAASHLSAPCLPPGPRTPGAQPVFAFGRSGGNIRPTRISIYGDGTITYQGVSPISVGYHVLPAAVLGLERLATAEGFDQMPSLIKSAHWLPDFATNFITLRVGCAGAPHTVRSQGLLQGGFTELYATLAAASALKN